MKKQFDLSENKEVILQIGFYLFLGIGYSNDEFDHEYYLALPFIVVNLTVRRLKNKTIKTK